MIRGKIVVLIILVCIQTFLYINLSAQGECLGGGCSGGTQFPSAEFSTGTDTWTIVSTVIYAGEYAIYNVTEGQTYEWSLCSADGGSSSYDSQLTLLREDGESTICYSNDVCNLNAKISWTASFNGKVRVLVNQFDCEINTIYTTLVWRCVTCESIPPPANNECSGAVTLSVYGETCVSATAGTVAGATGSGITSCFGTANNDVWYKFVATSANFHNISVVGSANFDAVIDLREGPSCTGTSIACADNTFSGGTEVLSANNLTEGQTYYIRVYDYYTSVPLTTDFTICVTTDETCSPSYSIGTGSGDFIDGVELVGESPSSISNKPSGGGVPYVKDYTAMSADLKPGYSYSIILTNGTYGGQTIAAWIDFNGDGVYSADEKLGELTNMDGAQVGTIIFTVPVGASLGATEMLVRCAWSQTNLDPCELYSFGEAEIYSIQIVSPCETPGPPTNLSVTPAETSASFTWAAPNDPAGSPVIYYYWAVSTSETITGWFDANIIEKVEAGTSLSGTTSVVLIPGTNYWLHMFAKTSCDNWVEASDWVSEPFTTSCITPGTPQSLTTDNITTSSAKLNWEAGNPVGTPQVTYYWAINTSSTVNYETDYTQRGTTTNLNVIVYSLNLNTQYYWTVKAETNCGTSSASSYASAINFTTLSVDAPLTWTGTTSTDWNTETNWNPQQVPTVTNNVIIPGGCSNYPIISSVGLSINNTDVTNRCKSLTIENGASVSVIGSALYVYCSGDLQINGTFNYSVGFFTNRFHILSGGGVVVNQTGILNIGNMSNTADRYNGIELKSGGVLSIFGGSVIIMNTLRHEGELTITGGNLYLKHYGGGGNNVPWDGYATSSTAISDGNVYISGVESGTRMIDWNPNQSMNITGGSIILENKKHSSGTDNHANLRLSGHVINNLVINRSGMTNTIQDVADNGVIITGNLTIENGTLDATTKNINLYGDWINESANAAFVGGTGTVELKGQNKDIKGEFSTSYNNLILSENSSYTITPTVGARINVNGDLTMNTGSELNIASGKVLDFYGDDAIINGDIIAADNLDGTRDFDINNNASLSGSGNIAADLRIFNNQTTLASNIDLDGDLIINQATSTLSLSTFNIDISGSWTNNGTFTAGTGSVLFSGVSKTIGGASTSSFYNLNFLDGSSYTVNPTADRISVTNTFLTEANSTLNLASGKRLSLFSSINTINGDITTSSTKYDEATLLNTGNFEIYIRRNNTLSGSGVIGADVMIFKDDGIESTTTLTSDITIDGSLWISNEWYGETNLVLGENKLTVAGNWISNGNFDAGTGTVLFNPTDNRTIRTFTPIVGGTVQTKNNFWNIKVQAAEDKTLVLGRDGSGVEHQTDNPYSGHLRVRNNLEVISGTFSTGPADIAGRKLISNNVTLIEEGASLNLGGLATSENLWGHYVSTFHGDIILRGNITTSRPISSGFAEIFLMGARLKSSGNVNEFGCDLQIHTSAITTQESDVYIQGDLIIQNDGTLICETNKTLTVAGNLYVYESLTHKGTVNVHGNMNSSIYTTNEINLSTSIFNFIQSSSKFTYLDKKIEFGEVNIIGGTRVFRQDIDCASDLTITAGSVMDMYTTTPRNLSLSQSANFVNNGSFIPYTGTASFTGNASQNITGSTPTTFYNLEVNNSGSGVSVQKTAQVSNQLLLTNGVFNTSTSNYINLQDQSSVSPTGGQANSFINGPIFKTGRDGVGGNYNFVFPTGKNGIWARIAIENHGGTTAETNQFMAEYFDYPYPVVSFDETIEAVSIVEYWNLTKISGDADLTKKIKLYSEDKDRSGIVSFILDDDLTVAHFNTETQKWEDIGLSGSNEAGITGWVISDFNSDFSPFTFGSTKGDNPLPVTLLHFGANIQDKKVITNWSTASEYNTDYFLVQKSEDLIGYKDVGVIKATGFSNEIRHYSLTDEDLWTGITYYRLKSVDFDNTYSYSNIVAVEYSEEENDKLDDNIPLIGFVDLFPNPVNSELNLLINLRDNTSVKIQIVDLRGKLLYSDISHITKGNNDLSLDVNYLSEGFYIISIISRDGRVSKKFIKAH